MKKASRPRREQPNMDLSETEPLQTAQDENFSLEDIMNEFGGWSKREPAVEPEPEAREPEPPESEPEWEPELASEPEAIAVEPSAPEPEQPVPAPPAPAIEAVRAQEGAEAPVKQPRERAKKVWTYQPPQPERRAAQAKRAKPAPRPKPRPKPQKTVIEFPSVEIAYKAACKATRGISVRTRLMGLWCLLAVAATVINYLQPSAMAFLAQGKTAAAILLGLLLVCAVTGYDVLMRGVYHCLRLSFGLESLLAVATVVFMVDGFSAMPSGKIPYTAVLSVGLFFALWAEGLQNKSRRRALKAVLSMTGEPSVAVLERKALQGRSCIFRTSGSRESFVGAFEAPDGASKAMRVYAPVVLFLSLVLSAVLYFLRGSNFLWSWSAMLAGSVPAAAFVVYWRPFASLCASLQRSGAALCGWQGVKNLVGKGYVAVEDTDLFSPAGISMNGMKIYGEYNVSQIVGYTYAVIAASGCGLEPTFREVFANQNGRQYLIDNFKRYDGGGVGAEIQGEVILIGSIGFMQLMGVRMPEGTNVRQAVYCAVNGELGAVFAINYNPSAAVKSGLQMVLRAKGLSLLLATRDFILTPAFVRHKYKIPSDSMEFPDVSERARLSDADKTLTGLPAVLFSRESFLALAEAVTGGRSLYNSVYVGVGVSLFGGALGFIITLLLAILGSFTVASAMNLMVFVILWTLPVLLLTAIAGK